VRLSNQQQKYFLYDLFSRPRGTCHAQRITIERRLMLLVKREERQFIAACRTLLSSASDFSSRIFIFELDVLPLFNGYSPYGRKKFPPNGEQRRSYEKEKRGIGLNLMGRLSE